MKRKRLGRPPSGRGPGEKVHEYPQLSVRVPPDVKARLATLCVSQRLPQWRIVSDALACYAERVAQGGGARGGNSRSPASDQRAGIAKRPRSRR